MAQMGPGRAGPGDGDPRQAPRAPGTRERSTHSQPQPRHHHHHPTRVPALGTCPSPWTPSTAPELLQCLFFPPGQMELLKAMGVTEPLQPGQGASPAPHGHPAPLDPLPTGHGMDVCPLRCTMPGGNELFQTTFSGRDGPGSQARRWQPWPLSSPSLPPTLLPSSPPLRLNDFHMGLWQAEPSLPALSEISKFRRNMKIVKLPFLRG